jgi:hypothetical protein
MGETALETRAGVDDGIGETALETRAGLNGSLRGVGTVIETRAVVGVDRMVSRGDKMISTVYSHSVGHCHLSNEVIH